MSSRTLARKMAAEELSFSKILNQLRSDLATYYLSDADLSISQIAWLVGYQGIGAFSHSYKALDRIECKEDARKVDSEPQENVSVGPKGDRL